MKIKKVPMKNNVYFILVFLILSVVSLGAYSQELEFDVLFIGTVVDRYGNSISGASVTFVPESKCHDCVDQLFTGYETDSNGKFVAGDSGYTNGEKFALVVRTDGTKGVWNPVDWLMLVRNFRQFRRDFYVTNGGIDLDLGEIHPDLIYKKVSVDFNNLFKVSNSHVSEVSPRVSIFLNGKILRENFEVPDSALDEETGELNLLLPEAVWLMKIELFVENEYRSKEIMIDNTDTNAKIYVIASLVS